MASTDAIPVPRKNVAYRLYFAIYKNDGTLITGAAGLDSEISKDGGTAADCTNEATEIATSTGMYYLDLTSTEMNVDSAAIVVKTSSTGAVIPTFFLYPQETGDIKVDVTSYGGTAGTFASGRPETNTTHFAGTAITAASGIPEVKINLPVGAVPSLGIIDNGTMQSGTSGGGVIRSAASFADDIVNNTVIEITGGTGAGQVRLIVDYTGSTDTITVNPNWITTPDNTSTYIIRAAPPAPTTTTYMPSVLVSVGTGTGQINAASGKVPATVAAGDIANSAITAASIAADAITAAKIADGAIDAATFAAGAINAAAIAADAITDAKVAADVTIASVTGAVGSVTGLTASDVGAIKAKTDSLTFTAAGKVDAAVKIVGTTTLSAAGTGGQGYGG